MMPNVAELLERESKKVDLELGHFERLLRRRYRKRRNQRIGAGMLAILIALVSFVALTRAFSGGERPADEPSAPAYVGMVIRYTSDARTAGDLVAADPNTGETQPLVDAHTLTSRFTTRLIGSAAWSADRRWAAFEIVACGGGNTSQTGMGGLWVTNGLNEPRQLTRPCFENPRAGYAGERWAWLPVGEQLVVARVSGHGHRLALIDPATGDRTDLGETVGDVSSLAWSPDGSRIVYGTSRGAVYAVSVGSGAQMLVANFPGEVAGSVFGSGAGITWSPDGAHIAVQAGHVQDGSAVDTLYVMGVDGSGRHRLAEGLQVQSVYFGSNLAWSPDGTRMAFVTFSGGGKMKRMQVWVGSQDRSGPRLIFESAPAASYQTAGPVWSPDGAHIAFGSSTPDETAVWFVANADGTGVARRFDELKYLSLRGGWYFCGCYG